MWGAEGRQQRVGLGGRGEEGEGRKGRQQQGLGAGPGAGGQGSHGHLHTQARPGCMLAIRPAFPRQPCCLGEAKATSSHVPRLPQPYTPRKVASCPAGNAATSITVRAEDKTQALVFFSSSPCRATPAQGERAGCRSFCSRANSFQDRGRYTSANTITHPSPAT